MTRLCHGICRPCHKMSCKLVGCPSLLHWVSPFWKDFLLSSTGTTLVPTIVGDLSNITQRLRRALLNSVQHVIKFWNYINFIEIPVRNRNGKGKLELTIFHKGIQLWDFCSSWTGLQRVTWRWPVALVEVLAGSTMTFSESKSHENVESARNYTRFIHEWKPPYRCKNLLKQLAAALKIRYMWGHSLCSVINKRRVTTAFLFRTSTSVSTSVDTVPVLERPGTSPTGVEKLITIYSKTPGKTLQQAEKRNSQKQPWVDPLLVVNLAILRKKWLCRPRSPIGTHQRLQESNHRGALRVSRKNSTLWEKNIPH